MLTEADLLENQTQTLEEALDRLNDRSDETIEKAVAHDVGTDALNIAVESLKTLVDLKRTISTEGVSLADVQAIRAVQARMSPFVRLPTKVALEAYEGMFTPTRSVINQTVSQEAVLSEIGKTLKEWFFIFVDFIIRVSDWCRKVWNSEDIIRGRLKLFDTNLQLLNNALTDLMKFDLALGRDPTEDLFKIADLLLDDPKLTRSESMLQAFNVSKGTGTPGASIKNIDRSTDRCVDKLMVEISALKDHIEKNEPMAIGVHFDVELGVNAKLLQDMTVADIDPEEFKQKVRRDFWIDPKKLVSRPIFAPSHNIEQVQRLAKAVRNIKRNVNFDGLKEVDTLVDAIGVLSESIKHLEEIIKFKQQLYSDYYKASATYANFYIRAYEFVDEDIKAHANEDLDIKAVQRASKVWESILSRMGL